MIIPGEKGTLKIESVAWTGVAVASLFIAERGLDFRDALAVAYEQGRFGVEFETEKEVTETLDACVSVASLNGWDVPVSPIVQARYDSIHDPEQKKATLLISDGAAKLLRKCTEGPLFIDHAILPHYAGVISLLQPRKPIPETVN